MQSGPPPSSYDLPSAREGTTSCTAWSRSRAARHGRNRHGRGHAQRDAGLSDRFRARSLVRDRVQPAAMKWFGQPVAEIRQISAYSCRGMNGQRGAHLRARVRQCARRRVVHARRRPQGHGKTAGAARRRSRASCATCTPPPASSSRPCSRPAPTPSTTTTSMSTCAARERPARVQSARGPRRSGRGAGACAVCAAGRGRDPNVTGWIRHPPQDGAEQVRANRLRRRQDRPSAAAGGARRRRRGLVQKNQVESVG